MYLNRPTFPKRTIFVAFLWLFSQLTHAQAEEESFCTTALVASKKAICGPRVCIATSTSRFDGTQPMPISGDIQFNGVNVKVRAVNDQTKHVQKLIKELKARSINDDYSEYQVFSFVFQKKRIWPLPPAIEVIDVYATSHNPTHVHENAISEAIRNSDALKRLRKSPIELVYAFGLHVHPPLNEVRRVTGTQMRPWIYSSQFVSDIDVKALGFFAAWLKRETGREVKFDGIVAPMGPMSDQTAFVIESVKPDLQFLKEFETGGFYP